LCRHTAVSVSAIRGPVRHHTVNTAEKFPGSLLGKVFNLNFWKSASLISAAYFDYFEQREEEIEEERIPLQFPDYPAEAKY